MFKRVLIANRGEIAVRVAQTVQEMGMCAVAVYSDVDRGALHVRCADETYALDGVTAGETYLDIEKIVGVAKSQGIDAIHPGYGFLSENAAFAEACAEAGMVFIGPTPEVIRTMGDKIIAKQRMVDAGVPVVPGWSESDDPKKIAKAAKSLGYPVLIKAAAGGGGKGMRVVQSAKELPEGLAAAQREANAAFGDGRVFLEKYIARSRHVEFQIFGDNHGNVVHLFERECSIQRRHQKIVEESPSPALSPELRARMGEAAVLAAKAIGYTGAGTVEFMLEESGAFYFLEVNTRLQVEHPVTEMTVGHDLVRAQILVAAGDRLPFSQDDLKQTGWSVECRVYAEDASRGFLPSSGVIEHYVEPTGAGVRVDSGVAAGSEVSVYYDPMLAKLVTWGRDREQALDKMAWALRRFVVVGVTTNIEFLQRLMDHAEFRGGKLHTQFLEEHEKTLARPESDRGEATAIIAAAFAAGSLSAGGSSVNGQSGNSPCDDRGPWRTAQAWRAG